MKKMLQNKRIIHFWFDYFLVLMQNRKLEIENFPIYDP